MLTSRHFYATTSLVSVSVYAVSSSWKDLKLFGTINCARYFVKPGHGVYWLSLFNVGTVAPPVILIGLELCFTSCSN